MLDELVPKLIALKHEGGYWDFKKQWYECNSNGRASLLIDIICMSNNLENVDGYIIFGVDEGDDYKINDIRSDLNRKNTQNLTDFLKDKKFMGGIRPVVRAESITIDGKLIDVLIVENGYHTPYMLEDDFENIKSFHVYTRIQDTNTPRNKSADIDKVEQLFKKRFRLTESPLEKVNYYLQDPNGWEESNVFSGQEYYYKHSPEQFTIQFRSDSKDERCEFWSLMFPDSSRSNNLDIIEMKWNGIVISNKYEYAPLDGGQSYCVMPEIDCILYNGKYYRYFYLVRDTMRYYIYEFIWIKLHHNDVDRYKKPIEGRFIIFDNINEKNKFNSTINSDPKHIAEELDKQRSSQENAHLQSAGFHYGFSDLDKCDYIDSRYFCKLYQEKFVE